MSILSFLITLGLIGLGIWVLFFGLHILIIVFVGIGVLLSAIWHWACEQFK